MCKQIYLEGKTMKGGLRSEKGGCIRAIKQRTDPQRGESATIGTSKGFVRTGGPRARLEEGWHNLEKKTNQKSRAAWQGRFAYTD